MNSSSSTGSVPIIRGYLEGYYGKLLSWEQRSELLERLSSLTLNTYCYAPKEDVRHRLHWRQHYDELWTRSFSKFADRAKTEDVSIVAGIAPGLDFNFRDTASDNDLDHLINKARVLKRAGASDILVLWDDIEADGYENHHGVSEGTAHALTVNRLSDTLGCSVWTVPRVYAGDIEDSNRYCEDFFTTLDAEHTVLLCGKAIVASSVEHEDLQVLSGGSRPDHAGKRQLKHRTVVWDNFYANDYCPRRLFVGPWTGRTRIDHYLLNPTGMPYTDQLLLDIAVSTQSPSDAQPHAHAEEHADEFTDARAHTHIKPDIYENWRSALNRHGVPDAFQVIAPYFFHPFFGDRIPTGDMQDTLCEWGNADPSSTDIETAIDTCLWKWKSPLAREWYPYLFGLKHDLALRANTLPVERVLKTQSPPLVDRLLS